MAYSIDEIYDMLIWDGRLSEQEQKEKEEQGIKEAMKIRNLYPFIQPMLAPPQNSKAVWDNCARVIALRSDEELEHYLYWLFEWLQDMNWPGAYIIFDRLLKIPYDTLKGYYEYSKKKAQLTNDELWLIALDDFITKVQK